MSGKWRPISEAARDGTPILGYVDCVIYACWYNKGWCFFDSGEGESFRFYPTHWQPLPPPPEESA